MGRVLHGQDRVTLERWWIETAGPFKVVQYPLCFGLGRKGAGGRALDETQ